MGVSNYSMADIATLVGATNTNIAQNSTSRPNNTELNMEDFLKLMVTQLQSQTMDDTMDTSEMMNQMVQMQMITAITNMTETSIMGYAASLVGQVVTIGILDGGNLEEREILVTGTGVSNGQQVIFGSDGKTYGLNQIMAIGHLPPIEGEEGADKTEGEENADKVDGGEGAENAGQNPDAPVDQTQGANPAYDGTQGAPNE